MKWFKNKRQEVDKLEQRLDTISDLTRDLGRAEFNNLIEALKSIFDARQKLKRVKTDEEKDVEDIEDIERKLDKENRK